MTNNTFEIVKNIIIREVERGKVFFPFGNDLSQREKLVLKLRKEGCSLVKIGRHLGRVSRQRVEQIENRALAKVEKRNAIIGYLARQISEVVFVDGEIEEAMGGWFKNNKVFVYEPSDFIKYLWRKKQRSEKHNY